MLKMIKSSEPITPGAANFGCEFPTDSEIMSVVVDGPNAYIYAVGDPSSPMETRTFTAPAVGQEVPEEDTLFIDSVVLGSPRVVYHIFELI